MFGPMRGIRCVVDCTEHEIIRPNDGEQERAMWSHKAKFPSVKSQGTMFHLLSDQLFA